MPTRAQRICKYPGCNKVVDYGGSAYCETHRAAQVDNRAKLSKSYDVVRPERHKFYHTARWRRVSEALTRAPQSQHVTLEYNADENILQHRDYPSHLDSPR